MKLFVIIATIVACASAAPTAELLHPSPVNPNVLVEIKPEEKIVLITDPKELAKFKRETKQPLYPTVLPEEHVHHITKREATQNPILPPEVITEKNTEPKSNFQVDVTTNSNNDNKKTQNDQEKDDKNVTTEVYQKPQGLPAIFSPSNEAIQQQKRDIPVPLVAKHQHPEESPKETDEKVIHKDHDDQKVKEVFQKPQGLPAIFSPANDATQPQKRDIPVPLVPKYHHPEESPKESNEKQDQENKKEVVSETHHNEDHVKPQLLQKPFEVTQEHKRDIPVPLVPKYHHPEESSPKESNEKEDKENKKEVHNEDHVTAEGFQKPQPLPLLLKERHEDSQHKRDIPVPLVPKYHHPEESPKESNEKEEDHEDKKEVNTGNHHDSQHDHIVKVGLEKPQLLPAIAKESPEDTQHKRDIPVPLVPKYHHPEESPKESNEDKKDHEDKKEVKIEDHHVPLTFPAHHHDHVIAEGFQKPQTLPLIIKETPEDTKQNKRDIPVPLVPKYQHPEDREDKKDHEDKKEGNLEKPQQSQTNLKELNEDSQQQKRDVLVTKDETPKDNNSNEKKPQEENSHQYPVSQIHHVAQTLPNYHHEHVNFESIHRPQVLALNQEHASPPTLQKPEFLLKHQDHIIQNDNEKGVDDVKPHHISQTLPGHIHKHLTAEGLQKPQILPLHNQEHTVVSTAALTHLPTHFHPENLKKPQIDSTKSDISATVMDHHQHEEEKKVTTEVKAPDDHPNKHEVQVEDLSDSKPFQQPTHHVLNMHGDHKPNILDDHLSAHDFTTSTTTIPSILRHRPVPVAELFARAHGN